MNGEAHNHDRNTHRDEILRAWLPLAYVINALFGLSILALSLVQQSGYVVAGAWILLLLAVGNYLGIRWSMAASIAIALLIGLLAVYGWAILGIRPALIMVFFPPLVVVFNALSLYGKISRR